MNRVKLRGWEFEYEVPWKDIIMDDKTKYIGFVEADAGITVEADSKEQAEQILEDEVDTGHLGPAQVRTVEEF